MLSTTILYHYLVLVQPQIPSLWSSITWARNVCLWQLWCAHCHGVVDLQLMLRSHWMMMTMKGSVWFQSQTASTWTCLQAGQLPRPLLWRNLQQHPPKVISVTQELSSCTCLITYLLDHVPVIISLRCDYCEHPLVWLLASVSLSIQHYTCLINCRKCFYACLPHHVYYMKLALLLSYYVIFLQCSLIFYWSCGCKSNIQVNLDLHIAPFVTKIQQGRWCDQSCLFICPSVCFHSGVWTNWPSPCYFGAHIGHESLPRIESQS